MLADAPDVTGAVWRGLSSISAEMLTEQGRIYGGALHKLEPKELANVSAGPLSKALCDIRGFKMTRQLELHHRAKTG